MKTNLLIAIAASLLVSPIATAQKEDDHKHEHAVAGPNGGKVLHEVEPHAELFVTKDRKIQITFLSDDGKAIAPAEQSIAIVCGKRTAPVKMAFAKKENSFLSDKALPEGMNIPAVVQITAKPGAKKTTIRLNLNLEKCPTCEYQEYACTCEHD